MGGPVPGFLSLVSIAQGGVVGGVVIGPLGIDSDMEGGERVEQPGEGGGAEEDPLDKLLELLSTALD